MATGSLTDGALHPYVYVFHPYDQRPLAGVDVTLRLDSLDVSASGTTDGRGMANLALPIPDDFDNSPSLLTAVVRHRGAERRVETQLSVPVRVALNGTEQTLGPWQPLLLPLAPGRHRLRVESADVSVWSPVEVRVRYFVPWTSGTQVLTVDAFDDRFSGLPLPSPALGFLVPR